MNLSLVLNLTPATANAANPAVQGENGPELAAFQDFLTLVGLPPMAAGGLDEAAGEGAGSEGEALLQDMTGNFLPPQLPGALPVLPVALPDVPEQAVLPGEAALALPVLPVPAMTSQALAGGQPVNQPRREGAAETAPALVMPAPLAQPPILPNISALQWRAAMPRASAWPWSR